MDDKEKNLPKWAQELIGGLRERIDATRLQVEALKARNEALAYLLECAARGGHETSQEIVEIIGTYDLVLQKREDGI